MTSLQIFTLAEIAAAQARIAGMQAANAQQPESQPYDAKAFFYESDELQRLSRQVLNS